MKVFGKGPWPLSTIVLTSVVFTPIVGSILAAVNEKRLGHPERHWMYYGLCIFSFLWYIFFISFLHYHMSDILDGVGFLELPARLLPPLHVFISVLLFPFTNEPYLALLPTLPFAAIIYGIVILQRQSWNEERVKQIGLSSPWFAYLFSAFITLIFGFIIFVLLRFAKVIGTRLLSLPWQVRSINAGP